VEAGESNDPILLTEHPVVMVENEFEDGLHFVKNISAHAQKS
jgi:hypothetical protein